MSSSGHAIDAGLAFSSHRNNASLTMLGEKTLVDTQGR
jgi:hypothetical protein